jgi:glycerol-3-phosphate dehydrogenase (NAD(P)+)
MSKIIADESCIKLIGVLSGPNLAKEIMSGYPAATVIASKFDFVIKTISKIISSDKFMVFAQRDVLGVEVAGALKNVIAIASGIGEGLGLGINATSFLVTLGISEIKFLAIKLGGKPETFYGLAGTGDLMATSFSNLSRNFRFGELIGKSNGVQNALNSVDQVVEGYNTTKVAYLFAKSIGVKMPIVEAVYQILYKDASVKNVLNELLKIRKDYLWE